MQIMKTMEPRWATVVPELLVTNLSQSLRFWVGLCGFSVAYSRLDEGFAYLDRAGAQVMLEEQGIIRNWVTGPMERPFGRGINFQITVSDIDPIVDDLRRADWALFLEPEVKWYRADSTELGVRQFIVQDPDGYLLRFSSRHGERPVKHIPALP